MLADKSVGIVGCGSVGSKVAASLCRTGVGKFLLIDEDIFFPRQCSAQRVGPERHGRA
ncbi:ThiF family adenylyltransferase [Yangia mangrovi]|uniref:ThiF family adenylyltransferase n=1 Tax=Alloyangia mangrovi TaxID=1779329 RepID=A0ABT2KRN4_9RHOB|nr:ThiF family adenylyltransferase [Alloyangia mangrovi]MCT4372027.1 ThiF family adenylyltransferase [Alloyangia mangrovi]